MRKKRHINLLLLIFMSGLIFYYVITYIKQQDEISLIKSEIYTLEQKIEKEKEIYKDLLEQVNQVGTDEFVEKIAREKLGMVKEGERLYIDTN